MEELKLRHQQLVKAYTRLQYMIDTFTQLMRKHVPSDSACDADENELITHRDALIQRFEFCFDLTWKFLKVALKEQHGIEATSPRSVFHACYKQNIISKEEGEALIDMIDARNQTSHVYDEEMAEAISKKIVGYYPTLARIAKHIAI